MKVKVIIEINLDTGEFSTQFANITSPGDGMDYGEINSVLKKIFNNVDEQIGVATSEDDRIIKLVH